MRGGSIHDDRGATMVEYGLVLVLVAVILIGLVQTLGLSVLGMFESALDAF